MIKKIFLLTIALQLAALLIYGQEKKNQFSLGLGAGVDIISFKDISSSPLKYSGFGLPVYAQVNYKRKKYTHQLDFTLISQAITNNYLIKSKLNSQLKTWDKINVNYNFLFQLEDSLNFVGFSVRNRFFYREYDFLDGFSWDYTGSIHLDYLRSIKVSKKYSINPSISLSLLGFIHRKPSLTLDEEFLDDYYNNGGIIKYGKWKTLFNDWFDLKLAVQHQFRLNNRLTLEAEIALHYYYINIPEKVTNFNVPLICYLKYQF